MQAFPRHLAGVFIVGVSVLLTARGAAAENGYSDRLRQGAIDGGDSFYEPSFSDVFSHRKTRSAPSLLQQQQSQSLDPEPQDAIPNDSALVYRPEELHALADPKLAASTP